ncbi:MAG: hypothetical protein M0Z55_11515 [Peptococcaceae bacterium]|nr:hypothetical protein [Peptococcaceae bacterium]
MIDETQVLVSSLLEKVDLFATEYYKFNMPSKAKELFTVNIQNKNIRISEVGQNLKSDLILNLRVVYVEQDTHALKVRHLRIHSTLFERRMCSIAGRHYRTYMAPDSIINVFLLTPTIVAARAKFHVVAKVFATQDKFIHELKVNKNETGATCTKDNQIAIPGVGTITVSLV